MKAIVLTKGDDVQLWIRLARQGGCLFTSLIAGYRTEWSGNSHHSADVIDRYLANIDLKEQIAEALQIKLHKRIVRRVAMHWILVAIKHSKFRKAATNRAQDLKRFHFHLRVQRQRRQETGFIRLETVALTIGQS